MKGEALSVPRTPEDYERDRCLLMNAIAESVAETSAEVLWTECREDGADVEAIASRTKMVLAEVVKRHKQQKLRQARAEYETHASSTWKRVFSLPQSILKQRELLAAVFTMKPELQGLVTAAARDFQALTDNDVELMLKQLQELGALDDMPREDNHR